MADGDRQAAVARPAADVNRQRSAKRRVRQQALADYAPVILFAVGCAVIRASRAAHAGRKEAYR